MVKGKDPLRKDLNLFRCLKKEQGKWIRSGIENRKIVRKKKTGKHGSSDNLILLQLSRIISVDVKSTSTLLFGKNMRRVVGLQEEEEEEEG